MGSILRKLTEYGIKKGAKASEVNPSNPLTQDTVSFIVDIAKELIKPF